MTATETQIDEVGSDTSEKLAAQHNAMHSILDDVIAYRTACESRGLSPTAAECMALDYHRFVYQEADRAAQVATATLLSKLRLVDAFVGSVGK